MLIPPPLPAFTLSPSIEGVDEEDLAAVERCLAALAGRLPGVLVTAVGHDGGRRTIEMATAVGPIILTEGPGPAVGAPA